jgi:hypothetical protein
MALALQDFSIEQGSTFVLQFDLKKDDGTALPTIGATGNPVNFVQGNYSFRMKMRKSKYRGNTAALSISNTTVLGLNSPSYAGFTADGFYLVSPTIGRVRLVLSAETTAALKYGDYAYDIEAVDSSSGAEEVTKVLLGKLEVIAEATN